MEEVSWVAKAVGLLICVGIFAVLIITAKTSKKNKQTPE